MRGYNGLLCIISSVFLLGTSLPVEKGVMVLHVSDVKGRSVTDVCLSTRGDGSSACTDQNGKARLELAPETQPGDQVSLQIAAGSESDWVFIDPYDNRVIVPRFENESDNFAQVVLGSRGSKDLLRSGKTLKAFLEKANSAIREKLSDGRNGAEITEEVRRSVLENQARKFGLDREKVNQAIREWKQRVEDPYNKGLIALYEQNYSEATRRLTTSLSMRQQELSKARRETVNAAVSLSQSLLMQGKFIRASKAIKKVTSVRQRDAKNLFLLGIFLNMSADYPEADSVLHRALRIQEEELRPTHPDVATTLREIADLRIATARYSEADSLLQRALRIQEQGLELEKPDVAHSTTSSPTSVDTVIVAEEVTDTARVGARFPGWDRKKPTNPDSLSQRPVYSQEASRLDLVDTLEDLTDLYEEQGRYDEAESILQRILQIQQKYLQPKHPELANTLSSLALLSQKQGKTMKADSLHSRALRIQKQSFKSKNPFTSFSTLANLAQFHSRRYEFTQAESLSRKALEFAKQEDMSGFAVTSGLPRLLVYFAPFSDEAVETDSLMHHTLRIQEQNLGSRHPMVARTLSHMASYQDETDVTDSLYHRALHIQQETLGPGHPDALTTLSSIADLYQKQKRFAEADSIYRYVLQERRRSLGPNHPEVANTLSNLAMLSYEQGETVKADSFMQRSLRMRQQDAEAQGPVMVSLLSGLSLLAGSEGEVADIEARMRRVLEAQKQTLGPTHLNVAITLTSMSLHSYFQREKTEADSLLKSALRIVGPKFSREHFATIVELSGLILLSQDESKAAEVQPRLMRMIAEVGPDYVDAATTFKSLALKYEKSDQPVDFDALLQRMVTVIEQTLGQEHPMVAISLIGSALRSHDRGETTKTISLLKRAVDALEEELGRNHPALATFLEGYAIFLRKVGRNNQANRIEAQVRRIRGSKIQKDD